jgi:hypothetical protein
MLDGVRPVASDRAFLGHALEEQFSPARERRARNAMKVAVDGCDVKGE